MPRIGLCIHTVGGPLTIDPLDRKLAELARRMAFDEPIVPADLARTHAQHWPVWIELCRRQGGLTARSSDLAYRQQVDAARAWLDRVIAGHFPLNLSGAPRGIDPKPAMIRVAQLVRSLLSRAAGRDTAGDDQPKTLAERLMCDALIGGGDAELSPPRDAMVEVPILLAKTARAAGIVGTLRMWRVPAQGQDTRA